MAYFEPFFSISFSRLQTQQSKAWLLNPRPGGNSNPSLVGLGSPASAAFAKTMRSWVLTRGLKGPGIGIKNWWTRLPIGEEQ